MGFRCEDDCKNIKKNLAIVPDLINRTQIKSYLSITLKGGCRGGGGGGGRFESLVYPEEGFKSVN